MTDQPTLKRRATAGVVLAALGFLTAHVASELTEHTTLALMAALAIFVVGLVLVETALFRALDETFADAAVANSTAWQAEA